MVTSRGIVPTFLCIVPSCVQHDWSLLTLSDLDEDRIEELCVELLGNGVPGFHSCDGFHVDIPEPGDPEVLRACVAELGALARKPRCAELNLGAYLACDNGMSTDGCFGASCEGWESCPPLSTFYGYSTRTHPPAAR